MTHEEAPRGCCELSTCGDAVPGTHRPLCCSVSCPQAKEGELGKVSLSRKLLTQQYVWY